MSDKEERKRRSKHKRSRRSRSRSRSPSWSDRSRSRSHSHSRRRTRSGSSSYSRSPRRSYRSRSRSRDRHNRRSYSRSPYRSYRSRSRDRNRRRSYRDRYRNRSLSRSPRRTYRRERSTSPLSDRRRHVGSRDNPAENCCIGVFGLSLYTTEADLREVYTVYGPLERCEVVYDHKTGRSRGFAFVTFQNVDDARDAKIRTDGMDIDGRRIRVDFSITKRAHTPTPGIYMGQPTYLRREHRENSPYRGRSRGRSYSRSRSRSPHRSRKKSWTRSRSRSRS